MKGCDHMIYTVTLNPALDYVVHAVSLHTGVVQRATSAKLLPAGKGVNVSLLLHGLGCPTRAVGIKAGWTGDAVESGLRAIGCAGPFFSQEEGMTRINVKLRHGMETDVNLPGPAMELAAWNDLCTWLNGLESGDTVVFSGSVPPPLGKDAYADLLRCLPKGVRAAVDTEGDRLLQTLPLNYQGAQGRPQDCVLLVKADHLCHSGHCQLFPLVQGQPVGQLLHFRHSHPSLLPSAYAHAPEDMIVGISNPGCRSAIGTAR